MICTWNVTQYFFHQDFDRTIFLCIYKSFHAIFAAIFIISRAIANAFGFIERARRSGGSLLTLRMPAARHLRLRTSTCVQPVSRRHRSIIISILHLALSGTKIIVPVRTRKFDKYYTAAKSSPSGYSEPACNYGKKRKRKKLLTSLEISTNGRYLFVLGTHKIKNA